MTEKLSGMEMMVKSLLKAAGFDPAAITQATVTVVQQMQDGLKLVTDRLGHIMREQEIAKIERRAIMAHLGVTFVSDVAISVPAEILPPEGASNDAAHNANGKG